MDFGRSFRFLITLRVERIYSLDSLTQLRDRYSKTMRNEDAFQNGESSRGDLEHQSKRAGAPKIFVVKRILRRRQMPGIVTSDHVDENDTKGPDVGFEGRIGDKLAIFIEAFLDGLSERGERGNGRDPPGLR